MKKRYFVLTLIIVAIFALSAFGFVGMYTGDMAYAESQTVDIYAINDFHGAVDKMPQIAGYLAARKSEGAVIVNAGDMFQGSMESNSNYGRLLSECMDIAGFDSFTYGNHEFDWGLDNLRTLAQNSTTPFLGANIYNWNANTREWGEFASDLAEPYTIVDSNGIKVGIIGIIGKDQITSISSQLVQTIGFKDPSEVVPSLSDKLRNEENCDIVIVSAHTGQDTFLEDRSWDISQYANAVLCAHTHQREMEYRGEVPFIQAGSYGNYISHIQLYININNEVKCGYREYITYNSIGDNEIDRDVYNTVKTKIDNSNAGIADEANQVLATLSGGLESKHAVPRLVCHAIAEYAEKQGHHIDLVMVNNARNSLSKGEVTYTELYEAIPFDNVVYVAKVSGKDIINEARYDSNSIWRVSGNAIVNNSAQYYTIAVIDYLLYHQNSNRIYNYFPSAFKSGFTPVALTKQGVEMYNYRHITRDFLLSNPTIDSSVYTSDNIHTDASKLQSSVDLPIYVEPVLPDYAIALIVVGGVIVVAVVVAIVIILLRKRAKANN
ncbi:MAG: 5'-nucleotidase C-terminal domain-containing protein [Clostridiales bacterium]|nr:5'-nucleotidase C-terminal domain-containing protein [Clostridiales bacterium]